MYLVNRTKLGRAMRATAENPRVAGLMGVRPDMVISATFIIGAALAARGRRDVGRQLRHGAALDGLPARPEGLHRGGARRHRQPRRRDGRRRAARPDRGARRGLHRRADRRRARQPLPGHLRLHRADPGADAAAVRACSASASPTGPEQEHRHDHARQQDRRLRRSPAIGADRCCRWSRSSSATPGCASSTSRCCTCCWRWA